MNKCKVNIVINDCFYFKYKQINYFKLITNNTFNENFLASTQPNSLNDFIQIVNNLKDSFALIFDNPEFLFVAVDKLRSFPLIYNIQNNNVFVGNEISNTIKKSTSIDENQIEIFKTIYTTNNEYTLYKNIKQLNSGQYLFINKVNQNIKVQYYFKHENTTSLFNEANLLQAYHEQIQTIKHNYSTKMLVVPLSAGYDSRTILALLKLNNMNNVVTYTYGIKNSFEHKIAIKVANKLAYKHIFIEYNEECLNEFLSNEFIEFAKMNHYYTGLPNEQDYFALATMKKHSLIPENALFLPGTFGDCFAASMFNAEFYKTYFKKKNGNLLNYRQWYSINRAAKFSTNGVRTFEFFGYPWFILFNHSDIFKNWYRTPSQNAYLAYENFLMKHFFKPLKIDFYKPVNFKISRIKEIIKQLLPNSLVNYIKNKNMKTTQNDPINAKYLAQQLKGLITNKKYQKQNNFNTLWAYYFIHKILLNEEDI